MMEMVRKIKEEIREYANSLAYSLDHGATEITAAPWNEWAQDWRNNNLARGPMLIFKKFSLNRKIKVEVWEFYSHTYTDGLEGDQIEEADLSTLKKLFTFYFPK